LLLLCLGTLLTACGGRGSTVEDAGPEALYDRGRSAMESSNYPLAAQYFMALQSRYPFSNVTRQAQLDLIHVFYRGGEPERAIDAAEVFERENPTHPRVDYALYMRGVIYFDQAPNILERLFRVDMTARPPKDTMRSFSVFQRLIREHPDSQYVADARQRMVFLRNRLAAYENHVASYWMERGAYVAAVNRAKFALENYPGAPALEESLEIMAAAYDELGMDDLARDARRVLQESFGHTGTAARRR
jgi:outer membrane protein assembly factor BamD